MRASLLVTPLTALQGVQGLSVLDIAKELNRLQVWVATGLV